MDWDAFARRWRDDWNRRDLDSLLDHFAEDVIFTSPVAAQVIPGSRGRIIGKSALRAYWTEGLRRRPDLHFTIDHVFVGVDVLVIQYRNQAGGRVSEVLQFRDGLVTAGHGAYATPPLDPA